MTALVLAGLLAAQPPQQPPAAPPGPPPPELEAVRPFAVLFGDHDTVTTEYGPDGRPAGLPVRGYERIFVKGQIAVVCDRGSEDGYDDLMVYQYDQDAKAVKGFLFMPLPKPRVIDVAHKDGVFTLSYPPLAVGDRIVTTRETITPEKGGGYVRRVEHKQPDGGYKLVRTVRGGPPKPQPKPPGPGR